MTTDTLRNFVGLIAGLRTAKSLTQKASLNAMAAAVDFGARLLTTFIVTPFLVSGLGDFLYGVWLVLGDLTGYLTAASGRSSQTLKWVIASEQGSADYEEKRRHVGSAIAVWLLFLPFVTGLGVALVWFTPLWLRNVPLELYGTVRLATGILVAQMILITLVHIPQSVLEGENLGYKRMGLSAALVLLGGGFTCLALYLDTGLVGVAVASFLSLLLTGFLYVVIVRRYVPWFGVAKSSVDGRRRFFGLSVWFLMWRLVMRLMTAGDVVILGILASAELAAVYSLTKYAPEVLVNLVAMGVFGITPGLGGIMGAGDYARARQIRAEMMLFTWLAVTVVGSTILLWNQAFLELWVGPGRYTGTLPELLILLLVAQFILLRNDANIIDLTLELSTKVVIGLVSVTLSVVVAGVLVGRWDAGIPGLVLGLIAGRLILSVSYPLMIGRVLGLSFPAQLLASLRPLLATSVLFGLALWLKRASNDAWYLTLGWTGFVAAAGVTISSVALLAFFLGLSAADRRRLWSRVQTAMAAAS